MTTLRAPGMTEPRRIVPALTLLLTLAALPATANPIDSRPSILGSDGISTTAVASTPPTTSLREVCLARGQSQLTADAGSQPRPARPEGQENQDHGNGADEPEGKDSQGNHGDREEDRVAEGETLNA